MVFYRFPSNMLPVDTISLLQYHHPPFFPAFCKWDDDSRNDVCAEASVPPAGHVSLIIPVLFTLDSVGISIHPGFTAHRTGHGQSIRLPSTCNDGSLYATVRSRARMPWITVCDTVKSNDTVESFNATSRERWWLTAARQRRAWPRADARGTQSQSKKQGASETVQKPVYVLIERQFIIKRSAFKSVKCVRGK